MIHHLAFNIQRKLWSKTLSKHCNCVSLLCTSICKHVIYFIKTSSCGTLESTELNRHELLLSKHAKQRTIKEHLDFWVFASHITKQSLVWVALGDVTFYGLWKWTCVCTWHCVDIQDARIACSCSGTLTNGAFFAVPRDPNLAASVFFHLSPCAPLPANEVLVKHWRNVQPQSVPFCHLLHPLL